MRGRSHVVRQGLSEYPDETKASGRGEGDRVTTMRGEQRLAIKCVFGNPLFTASRRAHYHVGIDHTDVTSDPTP